MLHIFRTLLIALLSIILVMFNVSSAPAQGIADRVRLTRGSETGEVNDMTPYDLTLNKGRPGSRKVAVNEIKAVLFADEPSELAQARVNAANGAYANALAALEKIEVDSIRRDYIREDIEFYKAYCAGKLALGGQREIGDAGRQLNAFVRSYPQNFHYLAAVELMGDLLMATGRHENAQKQYAELAKAPWTDYKVRSAVAVGRTLQAQGKHAEAIQQFDAALATAGEGADAEEQKLDATLAKAVSMAETGGGNEAVGMIEKIIQDANPEQKELHARAYNALGSCYRKAGQTKDALLAYLHVDVLYNTVPEAHAESLANLAPLWQAVGQEEQARQARQLLQERYGGSRWAKQVQ
ncbi:MAG TPA: tetratricopeptide repeat protein [Lacipirellulaceae bacterium]